MVAHEVVTTGDTPVQTKENAMKNQLKVVLLTALFAIPAHSSADIRPSSSHTIEPSRNIFDLPINDLDPIAQESTAKGDVTSRQRQLLTGNILADQQVRSASDNHQKTA